MLSRCTPSRAARCRPHACLLAVATALLAHAAPAGAQTMNVGAVVISKSNCRFDTANLVLDFGTIDPASAAPATASVGGTVSCNGGQASTVTLGLTLGDGSYAGGPGARRMRHATALAEFMAYDVSISPRSATIPKNGSLAFTVSGAILAAQFQNVMAGNYTDTVTITVSP